MGYDPEWERRKAEGVALIQAGHAFSHAEAETGVPASTLHNALAKLRAGVATSEDMHRADQQVMSLTLALAAEAQTEQLRRLREGGVETRDLNAMAGLSLRALGLWRRWSAPSLDHGEPGAGSKLLDRLESMLASGAELTLSVSQRPPDADAVDIEATVLDDSVDSGDVRGDRQNG